MTASNARPVGVSGWVALLAVSVSCLALSAAFAFAGFLFGGEFMAGPRHPRQSAACWLLSALAAAAPVALLPTLGFRVRRGTSLAVAGGVALLWSVGGFVVSAR